MNAKLNNEVKALNEVTNNQLAFERFCELAERGYSFLVELKSKLKEKSSLWITVSKENEVTEEIHLLVNQEVLNLVIGYLETGKLEDASKINPNDLESFNERDIEFKRELFQNEKGKGKKVVWSYTVMGKLASMHYNHGTIVFHPYYYPVRETNGKNFVGEDYKEEKRKYPIVQGWFLENSPLCKVRENKEVINTDFNSNCSLHPCSLSGTFAPAKKEESLLVNNTSINNKNSSKMETKNFAPVNEKANEVQTLSQEQLNSENMKKPTKKATGLNPAKGNMYDFITHTWNPVKGICEHKCGYCYMSTLGKNPKPIRLVDKELKEDLGNNNFIFVGSSTDLFANNVKSKWIKEVLNYCDKFKNKYLFQSKNPERFMEFIAHPVFKKSVICTTIESNRDYEDCKAPTIEERVLAIEMIKSETHIDLYVTIEPIMDFDLNELVDLIKRCNPVQVNIGADSKRTGLTEPTREKTQELINALSTFTTVKEKKNLNKLMKKENPMENELKKAKKEDITSRMMKVQVMERTDNGYTIKKENRKFGLVKENRPIKPTDVNGFLQIIANGKYDDTQSIVTAEATELIGEYNLVDLEKNPISEEDAKDYLIVLDGQHRISAFAKLNAIRTQENQIVIPNVHIKKDVLVREYLADINMVGHNWSMADKVCVSAISTDNKLLLKVNELIKADFSASTATLICTGKRLKNTELKALLSKGDISCLQDDKYTLEERLERAEKFLTTAWTIYGMDVKTLRKRYFIKGFNSYAISIGSYETAFTKLAKLTIEDFKEVREDEEFIQKLQAA